MERKIKILLTVIFLFFTLGMLASNTIENRQIVKKVNASKITNKPNKPPVKRKMNHIFFEGVPIMKGEQLINKDDLIKNGYIFRQESFHIRHYSYLNVKEKGKKINQEDITISPKFIGNFKLYLKVNIKNSEISNDENKLIYRKNQFIKIKEDETFESIYSNSKIKVENLNAKDIKKEILKQKNFDLSGWKVDYYNSSFFYEKLTDSHNDFFKETDKDVRQGKFISFKKGNKYLFFFFRLDTETFDISKLDKISLSDAVFDSENNKIKPEYEKYMAAFLLLTEIKEKQIDFEKTIFKRFNRDDKQFLIVAYGDNFKVVELKIDKLDKDFATFVELVELATTKEINLFKKDKIEFTLAEIKKTFEKFITAFQIDEEEILNQLTKLTAHDETVDLNFYSENNFSKTILKTLKLKFRPAHEIEKLELSFKTNNEYFIADDKNIATLTSEELKKKTFAQSTTTLSSFETTLYTGFDTDLNTVITTIGEQLKQTLNTKDYQIYYTKDKSGNFLFTVKKLDTSELRVFKVKVRRISRDADFYELNKLFIFDYYQTEHNIQKILNYFNLKTDTFKNLNLEILNYATLNEDINKLKSSPHVYRKLKLSLTDKYQNIYSIYFFAEVRYGNAAPLKVANSFVDSKYTRFFMSSNLAFSNAATDLFGSYDLRRSNQTLRQWLDNECEDFTLNELNKTIKISYNFFNKDYLAMQSNLNTYLLYLNNNLDYSERELQLIFRNIFGVNITKIEKNKDGIYSVYLNNFREKQAIYVKHSLDLGKYRVSKEITKERISELFKSVSNTYKTNQKVIETLENLLKRIPELKMSKENTDTSAVILKIYSTLNKEIYKTFTVI